MLQCVSATIELMGDRMRPHLATLTTALPQVRAGRGLGGGPGLASQGWRSCGSRWAGQRLGSRWAAQGPPMPAGWPLGLSGGDMSARDGATPSASLGLPEQSPLRPLPPHSKPLTP